MHLNLTNLEDFRYNVNKGAYAYVEDDTLYMTKGVSFEKLMITATYSAKENYCYYCGRKFSKKVERTIDHIFPVSFGGITTIDNLIPCCSDCNEEKSNLTMTQYVKWKSIVSPEEKERYRCRCTGKNEKEYHKRGTIMPQDWVETRKAKLIAEINIDNKIKTKRRDEAKRFLWTYGVFKEPIVMSGNKFLLDGFITVWLAKDQGITKVPVIKYDNIIVI